MDVCWRVNVTRLSSPAGISQSYISQWLLQQGLEMSDSKRRAFYRWYLLERNNPGESPGGGRGGACFVRSGGYRVAF